MPLKTSITERYQVLADRSYTLTPYRSHIYGRIRFKGGSFRKSNITDTSGKGSIFCLVVTSGLHWDTNMKEYIQLTRSAKVPFRDNVQTLQFQNNVSNSMSIDQSTRATIKTQLFKSLVIGVFNS